MAIKSALMGVAGAFALIGSSSTLALAGCGGIGNCDVGAVHVGSQVDKFGPATIADAAPYGHLKRVDFQRSPYVSIMRVHGISGAPALKDSPHGFTQGCHPSSTMYCRHDAGQPVDVQMFNPAPAPAPVYNAPVVSAPVISAPVISAPVIAAPVQSERIVAIGKGYDPSKFTPRVYGDPTFVPGIAHVPTSIVDRDPVRAQQVLDSGRAVSKPFTPGGVVPSPSMVTTQVQSFGPSFAPMPTPRPAPVMAGGPVVGAIPTGFPGAAGAPVPVGNGVYGSSVGADGTYWEKVSGPTMMGSTVATSVVCKRRLPTQTVNPVVPVPYAVPTPVPGPVVTVPYCDAPKMKGHKGFSGKGRY